MTDVSSVRELAFPHNVEFEEGLWDEPDENNQGIPFVSYSHEDSDLALRVASLANRPLETHAAPHWRRGAGTWASFVVGAMTAGCMEELIAEVTAGTEHLSEEYQTDLENRLSEVNRHFRRKAASVLNDDAALRLLAEMYDERVVEMADFDFCSNGRPLAMLTAAHFCEVGPNSIYITRRGQQFINFLNSQ